MLCDKFICGIERLKYCWSNQLVNQQAEVFDFIFKSIVSEYFFGKLSLMKLICDLGHCYIINQLMWSVNNVHKIWNRTKDVLA